MLCRFGAVVAEPVDASGDWTVECDRDNELRCYLRQSILSQGTGQQVFEAALGYLGDPASGPVLVLSAPLGIYLPDGLLLQVDDGPVRRAMFARCNPRGCHAEIAADLAMLEELRRGVMLSVGFSDGAGQRFRVPVSLTGVSGGLRRLSDPGPGRADPAPDSRAQPAR